MTSIIMMELTNKLTTEIITEKFAEVIRAGGTTDDVLLLAEGVVASAIVLAADTMALKKSDKKYRAAVRMYTETFRDNLRVRLRRAMDIGLKSEEAEKNVQ